MARSLSETLDAILESWGLSAVRLNRRTRGEPGPGEHDRHLLLYLPRGEERVKVGSLHVERGEYVFRYADEYRRTGLPAIPDFPELDQTYRSERLFPFFEVRIPPLNRRDVAELLERRRVSRNDALGLLGELGSRSVTSPYELELRAA